MFVGSRIPKQSIIYKKIKSKQDYIPVGCVPPARRPYLRGPAGGQGGVPGLGVCTWSGGYLVGGCTWSGGVPGLGGYLVGGVYLVRYSPPVNRMTNRCKNITLPQTSFAGGNKYFQRNIRSDFLPES